ncbi:Somatostatin-1 [Liparis tanakae]|uniref:Somatostatin-1 n=1 Tax=Liparis tanakae TaxID=230148 RepID=A0A4Z2HSG6_9TELE|nr:Somatostatin-1 [Liparis tanakae]
MLGSRLLLAASLCSVLLVQVSGAARGDMRTLRADLADDKDLARLLLLRFVSELTAAKGEMLPELEGGGGEEEEEMEMIRRHLPLAQRERKAGCRNFFWKTFTSYFDDDVRANSGAVPMNVEPELPAGRATVIPVLN